MKSFNRNHRWPRAFTMLEMMVAMVASAFLLAGLGSVMYIARQVAYSPTAADRRAKSADIVNQISDELRYATVITQQTSQILEFVVADRNNDGTAEKIRYEWSGTAGDPLRKTVNGNTAVDVLPSVYAFAVTLQQKSKTTVLTTTTDSAETALLANTNAITTNFRDIDTLNFRAQRIYPLSFTGVPANATCWNCTKIDVHGKQNGTATETLTVQLRPAVDPNDAPTSNALGSASIAESAITASAGFNTVTFASPIRNLSLNRPYEMVFLQLSGAGKAFSLTTDDSLATGVTESSDGGASWTYNTTRQIFGRVYGTFTTPGPSYNVTRNYVSYVRLALQSGNLSHARIDTSIPLRNSPELLANYWRSDFDSNPAATNTNGDATTDWAVTGGGTFDTTKLASGIWTATGAIETRPLSDFATTTIVEARCRNTSVGGNGAVLAVYVDRQSGTYGPLLVYVQKQSDGTQTLSLYGRTSDTVTKQLFTRSRLSSGFVRFRLTVLPANDVVNLTINDEDQGTFTYPTYAPASTADRYLTLYSDTSSSEFDYVEVRSGIN
jgi:prepilin-type N-terminal cleavage/methylation domain-containing protein